MITKLKNLFRSNILVEYLPMLAVILIFFLISFLIIPQETRPHETATSASESYKCPKDYGTTEAYQESVLRWIVETRAKYPTVTDNEVIKKRKELTASLNCGIETYPEVYRADDLGFSFFYADYLSVERDPNTNNRIVISPKSWQNDSGEPFTAITVTVEKNSRALTLTKWLDDSDSVREFFSNYKTAKVAGREAISTNDGFAVAFNTPDQKQRIIISILLDAKNGAKPLHGEIATIIDTFTFDDSQ